MNLRDLPPPQIIQQVEIDSIWFERILALRASAYGKPGAGTHDEFDGHSLHFAAVLNETVIGATRVTFHKDGPLESQEVYPNWILSRFGPILGAASRMCVVANNGFGRELPIQLASHVWSIGIASGIRIDVTKARIDAIPYYLRMGYVFVRGSLFHFDRTDVVCGLIAYPANHEHKGKFSQLFADIELPCDLTDPEISPHFTSSFREVVNEHDLFTENSENLTE